MGPNIQYDNTSADTTNTLIENEHKQVDREWKIRIAAGIIIIILLLTIVFMSPIDEYVAYYRINKIEYTQDSVKITIGTKTFTSVRTKN